MAVEEIIENHPLTAETVTRIAEGFASGQMDGYDALDELLALVRAFEDRGPVCELHEEVMPALAGHGCDLCVRCTDELLSTARERSLDPIEFDAEYDDRNRLLQDRFASQEVIPRNIYHRGAFGIEPITYVLGDTAEGDARLAVSLVEEIHEAE